MTTPPLPPRTTSWPPQATAGFGLSLPPPRSSPGTAEPRGSSPQYDVHANDGPAARHAHAPTAPLQPPPRLINPAAIDRPSHYLASFGDSASTIIPEPATPLPAYDFEKERRDLTGGDEKARLKTLSEHNEMRNTTAVGGAFVLARGWLDKLTRHFIPQEEKDSKVFYSRITLIIMLTCCALMIILESVIMWRLRFLYEELQTIDKGHKMGWDVDVPQESTMAEIKAGNLYHGSFIASTLFLVYVTWDAVLQQNIIQIGAIAAYSLGNFVFSIIQIGQTRQTELDYGNFSKSFNEWDADPENGVANLTVADEGQVLPAEIGVVIISLLWWIAIMVLSYFLFLEFGWRIYRKIGGNIALEQDFKSYHVFLLCNKYSLLFECLFALIVLVASSKTAVKWATTLIGIPLVGAAFAAGYFGVRREIKWLLRMVQLANIVMAVYVIYYLVAAHQEDGADAQDFNYLD
ncbi:hypothetical protein HK101_001755 [Irineochytrium annulatum]|nr:hypothetical protein HK101_001755 [Irineochytrium annulatum]